MCGVFVCVCEKEEVCLYFIIYNLLQSYAQFGHQGLTCILVYDFLGGI